MIKISNREKNDRKASSMPNAGMGQAQRTVEEARKNGQPFEKEYFRKDGSLVPILIDAETFEGSEEKGSALIWKAVFENNPNMYFIVDPTGAILSVNRFGAQQLGYTTEELIGRPVEVLLHEADRDYAKRNIAICLEHLGQTLSWELRKIRKDREILWVRETGRAMLIQGRPVFLGVCEDITERKRAAEALREAQLQLAHANRVAMMGQLTASIAHEVIQPIASAVNNAHAALHWLDHAAPDLDEVRRTLGCVVRDGYRAGAVAQRIRNFSKNGTPRDERVDINAAIREVIELTHGEAIKSGILVQTELVKRLTLVRGDRVELQQVVLNLILNALEAMRGSSEGSQELLITTGETDSGGVLVSVRDSGPGLTTAATEHLFKAFHTTKPSGLGLGLSICRSIVEAHGGQIWASANSPRGAVFQFTLPAHPDVASGSVSSAWRAAGDRIMRKISTCERNNTKNDEFGVRYAVASA
jgi:PAS domain S-box-containing protein